MKRKIYGVIGILLVIVLMVPLLGTGCAQQPVEKAPIKIGVIFPITGYMALSSVSHVAAVQMAFEQVGNEIAGRQVELFVEDSAGEAGKAHDAAVKLVEQDKVCMVIGPTIGGEKIAVGDYMAKVGLPNIAPFPSPVPMIQQDEWSFLVGGTEPQTASCMGRYAYEEMGLRKVDIMTEDIVPGHGFLGAFMDTFTKAGGEIVQEQYTPVPCLDYASYLAALKDADAVVAWYEGAETVSFLTQYHEFGIDKKMPLVGAFFGAFLSPVMFPALSPETLDSLMGDLCPNYYTPELDATENKAFLQALSDYGTKVGKQLFPEDGEGAYLAAEVAIAALKATGGDTTPEKLRQAIPEVKLTSPAGSFRFDPATRCAVVDVYILKVDKTADGRYIQVPVYTYKDVPPTGY
jgi:branched-chain amino acid transport system substrate-binding protein